MAEKARVTQISYAGLEFEGLMLPDGSYAIAISQAWDLLDNSVIKNNRLRQVKALLGKDISVIKISTELNSQPTNILKLEQFAQLCLKLAINGNKIAEGIMYASTTEKLERIYKLAINGNKIAKEIIYASTTEKLERIYADAFNQKFEEEKAEVKFQARIDHMKQFHPRLTRHLKADGCVESRDYAMAVNTFKTYLGLPLISVNEYSTEELRIMNDAEKQYDVVRDFGRTHLEALNYIRNKAYDSKTT